MYEQAATPVKESTCIHFLVVRGWNYGIPQPQSIVSFVLILTCQRFELSTGKFDKWRFIYRETSKTIHFQSYREMQSFIFLRRQNVKKKENYCH